MREFILNFTAMFVVVMALAAFTSFGASFVVWDWVIYPWFIWRLILLVSVIIGLWYALDEHKDST